MFLPSLLEVRSKHQGLLNFSGVVQTFLTQLLWELMPCWALQTIPLALIIIKESWQKQRWGGSVDVAKVFLMFALPFLHFGFV